MHIYSRALAGVVALGLANLAAAQALWNGGGGSDTRWSTGENWQGGTSPSPGAPIRFLNAAVGSTARYNMLFSAIPSISVEKCGFSAVTDAGSVTPIIVQNVTSSCDGAGANLQSLLEMRLTLDPNASINALTTDAGNANLRRFIFRQPGPAGINAGANLVLNANSSLGAAGAQSILEVTLASGNGIFKTGNGRVDFLNANTYIGQTTIATGVLNAGNAQSLGATGPADFTTVRSVGTLAITAGSPVGEEIRLEDNSDVVGENPILASGGAANYTVSAAIAITGVASNQTGAFVANGTELRLLGGIIAAAPATTRVDYLAKAAGSTIVLGGPTNHGGLTKIGNNATLRLEGNTINDDRMSNNSIIDIDAGGLLNLNQNTASVETIFGLQGAGNVVLGNMDLTLNGEIDTTYSGNLNGGKVVKSGFNIVTTTGAFDPAELTINTGAFRLQGNSTAAVRLVGGILETMGERNVRGLNLLASPGGILDIGGTAVGQLNVVPNIVANAGIVIFGGQIRLDLNPVFSDQIVLSNANAVGGVTLSGGTLNFVGSLPVGASATIIDNQRPAANLISGTFAAPFGNPAGGTALINGNTYSYSYAGGNGNDFVITNLGTPLTITAMSLPAAPLTQLYSSTIVATGGTAPYIYGINFGTLPPGLVLQSNGLISGTPTAMGFYTFVVQATDTSMPPQTDTESFIINVMGNNFSWTGAGSTPNWSDAANWNPEMVPPNGSDLIFPAGVISKTATNDLSFASSFRSIQISDTGYLLNGVNLQLTDAVPLRYDPPSLSGPPSVITLPIAATALNPRISVNTTGSAIAPQALDIAAPAGGLNFTGNLRVEIACASCSAEADVFLRSSSPAGSSLSVFAPNGGVESVAATFDGIARIEAGTLVANSASALGAITGSLSDGTEIWRGAQLLIGTSITTEHLNFKTDGTGNPPKLAPLLAGQTFAGPILVEGDFTIMGSTAPFFQMTSDMIGVGNIQIVPAGGMPLAHAPVAARGVPTGVSFSGVSVSRNGDLSVASAAILQLDSANKLPATTNISLPPFSRLVVNTPQTIAGLTGSGTVEFGNATLTVSHNDTKTFDGVFTGAKGVLAFNSGNGDGRLQVSSLKPLSSASYRVDSGTLDLEGNSSTGSIRIANGVLAGDGATAGAVESLPGATGKIAPMLADLGTGNLNIGASLIYEATVNGAPAGAHSELQVTGDVAIGGAAALNVLSNTTIAIGTTITIISNDGVDAVTGTFAGLLDGALVTASNGQTFLIDYQGGDGNDVTLTRSVGLTTVTIGNINVTEGNTGNTSALVSFTRNNTATSFTLNYALATASASANDFVANTGTVSFVAGGQATATITVQTTGDDIVEAPETFIVFVANVPSGLSPIADGIVTILNDDTSTISLRPTIELEGTGGAAFGQVRFTVELNKPIQGVVTFNAASSGGTATVGGDYVAFNQTVNVNSGATSVDQNLSVARDLIVEANETVTFTLSGLSLPPGITISEVTLVASSNQLTIQNDDSAIITVNPLNQNEGNVGNTPFTVGLTLSAPVQGSLTVRLTPTRLAGDSATPLTDFSTTPVIATFSAAPGPSSTSVTLQVVGDTTVEPDETFSTVLDQIISVSGIAPGAFTLAPISKVTIVNDDLNAATTTTLSFNPSPSTAGQAYTATAIVRNVGPTFPTGTVVISTVPLSSESCSTPALVLLTSDSSSASCQITSALPGVRTYIATYVSTGAFTASSSVNVPHVVRGEVGNLQISSNLPAGVVTGQPYTITVGLTPTIAGAPAPTGTVVIQHFPSPQLDNGVMVGGTASIATFSSTAVIKTLFVSYIDPTGVYPNRNSAYAQVVNKADVALSGLNSTPQPSTVGQPVTASFVLSVAAPGAGTPTGTVTVTDGVDQCIATLPAASCVITLRTAGNRSLTYRYDGSIDYNAGLATRPHTVGNSVNGSDVEITVSNGVTVVPQDRIVQYAVRSRLLAGDAASNVRIQAAVPAGIVSQIWSCVAENGASCPPNSTNISGAIDALVTMPQGASALFVVSALTQTAEGRVQFTATASVAAPVVDPNPQNNSVTDNDVISNTAAESGFEDE